MDNDIQELIESLKRDIRAFKEGTRSLELAAEAASKHIPVYQRIVKSHIDQLASVLGLETHNKRNLESAGLAEPVIQLMQLFRELNEEDIEHLHELALETRNWSKEAPAVALEGANAAERLATEV